MKILAIKKKLMNNMDDFYEICEFIAYKLVDHYINIKINTYETNQ